MDNTWKIRAKGLAYLLADSFACTTTGIVASAPIAYTIKSTDRKLVTIGKVGIAFAVGIASALTMSRLQDERGLARNEFNTIFHPELFLETSEDCEDFEGEEA